MKAICNVCDFEEDFEPDLEFGLTFFQADGTCPNCGNPLVDEKGNPTRQEFIINLDKPPITRKSDSVNTNDIP